MLGHICLNAYTRSIQIYFCIFFDFIHVLLSFHCSHTVPMFSEFFPIFVAILFISKSLSFQHGTLICFHLGAPVPACCVESNCIIHVACVHLGARFPARQMESKPRASYEIIDWDGVYSRQQNCSDVWKFWIVH